MTVRDTPATDVDGGGGRQDRGSPTRVLHRTADDRMIAGVCGGMGRFFAVDPLWFRLGFLLLMLAGGTGVILYMAAWLVMPPEGASPRGAADVGRQGRLIAGVALVGIGVLLTLGTWVPRFDELVGPVLLVAAGAGLLIAGRRREQH